MQDHDVEISYTYKGLRLTINRDSKDDVNSIASDFEKLTRALKEVVERLETTT